MQATQIMQISYYQTSKPEIVIGLCCLNSHARNNYKTCKTCRIKVPPSMIEKLMRRLLKQHKIHVKSQNFMSKCKRKY